MDTLEKSLKTLLISYTFSDIQQKLKKIQIQASKKQVFITEKGKLKNIENDQLNELFNLCHGDSTNLVILLNVFCNL